MFKSNREIELAREFISNTNAHIFLTGKAGTGKTTFLHEVVRPVNKNVVVAAPTGVAALNARGVTLHSLFMLPLTPYIIADELFETKRKSNQRMNRKRLELLRSIELLVIDEISMVRADTLDGVDDTLKRVRRNSQPFGGVQLLLIGDVQQLAPVCRDEDWELLREHYKSPFFFDSKAFRKCRFEKIELQEIFRQTDSSFTSILNAIRDNRLTETMLRDLNARYIPNFDPPQDQGYITLTTHRQKAATINSVKLSELATDPMYYEARVKDDFPESIYPNDNVLELRVGAQVMFIKNGMSDNNLSYYNGMMGHVVELHDDTVVVHPMSGGDNLTVSTIEWQNVEYNLDRDSGEITERVKGTYTQIPLRCAWAITIHKSQGLSFDRVIIDIDRAFAHGQAYVGFSRCRSLEGLVLSAKFTPSSIIKDSLVHEFSEYVQKNQAREEDLVPLKRDYFIGELCDVFNFEQTAQSLRELSIVLAVDLGRVFGQLAREVKEFELEFSRDVVEVGKKFQSQITSLALQSEDCFNDEFIMERVVKAESYFRGRIDAIKPLVAKLEYVVADSKEVESKLSTHRQGLHVEYLLKSMLFDMCVNVGFTIEQARKLKMKAQRGELQKSAQQEQKSDRNLIKLSELEHAELYKLLCQWRKAEAEDQGLPLYGVLQNKALLQIATSLPRTEHELKCVKGIGAVKLKAYASQILEIVETYCQDQSLGNSEQVLF